MAQSNTDVYAENMQVVRQAVFPRLYPMSNKISAKILGNIEKHQITKTPGGSDFRAPIEIGNAAQFGAFSLAGGSLGLGGSFALQQLVQTTQSVKLGFQINADAKIGTANPKLSVASAFKKAMKDAVPLVQDYDDRSFFNITGSQGLIALSTGLTGAVYTMDNNFGANLVTPLQVVEVISSAMVNKTVAAAVSPDNLPYVSAVDYIAKTVTLANTAGLTAGNAMASGDYLAFQGVGTTPTWMQGLYYVNDSATSGTYLGLNRAQYPQIVATNYAASGTLTPAMGILIKHRITLRYGTIPKDLIGIMNVAQHAAIINQGINISTWFRSVAGQPVKPLDIAPAVEDVVDFVGVPVYLSTHQNQSRIDYVNKADWGRVWFGNTNQWDFWTDEEGRKVFPLRSANGAIAASELFYMWAAYAYYNVNPGAGGFISGLTLPTGY